VSQRRSDIDIIHVIEKVDSFWFQKLGRLLDDFSPESFLDRLVFFWPLRSLFLVRLAPSLLVFWLQLLEPAPVGQRYNDPSWSFFVLRKMRKTKRLKKVLNAFLWTDCVPYTLGPSYLETK
jgi:hypothetical protein